jgi:hypothetical protein
LPAVCSLALKVDPGMMKLMHMQSETFHVLFLGKAGVP